MDLGIAGRKAIVCASSKGLGAACALALSEAGVKVVVNGRDGERLERAAAALRAATGGEVEAVVADLGSEAGRMRLIEACPDPDILVNNNGGPPPKGFRDIDHAAMLAGLEANMIAPIHLIQAFVDGMAARQFGRIVNITSSSVKAPIAGLDLSSGARAGLTAFLAGVAREVAAANVTINAIQPGMFDTDRLRASTAGLAARSGKSEADARAERQRGVPAGRFGTPREFGLLCAFLCGAASGYITGQSILIDGGLVRHAF
jgi:3-oxoacyl-[acyl-carrier protein] reductase